MEHGITWGSFFFAPFEQWLAEWGIDPIPAIDALIVSVLLIVFAYVAGRRFRRTEIVEPDGNVSLAYLVEFGLGAMLAFFGGIIQNGARNLFFLLGTFTFFILGNNLIGNDSGCGFITGDGDTMGTEARPVDARLGALAGNGGPTDRKAMLRGSPAKRGAGDGAGPRGDQRGV